MFAAVESDIVGYTTIEMQAGKWYQIGNPFVELENSQEETPINEIFSEGFERGDILCTIDVGNSYFTSYYWNANKNGWSEIANPNAELTDAALKIGEAVYITKKADGVVTLKGKVEAHDVSFGSESGNTYSQIVLVWPQMTKINDITWSNMTHEDTLQILDSDSSVFTTYYWNERKNGWSDIANPNAPLSEAVVDVAQAFYIHKVSPGIGEMSIKR